VNSVASQGTILAPPDVASPGSKDAGSTSASSTVLAVKDRGGEGSGYGDFNRATASPEGVGGFDRQFNLPISA